MKLSITVAVDTDPRVVNRWLTLDGNGVTA